MNETPVTDLDDGSDDIARRVRDGVLGAHLHGPGPDLATVRTRGRRRRRRRQGVRAGALALAATAVVAVVVGVLPGRNGFLVASPPTATEVLQTLGEPAPPSGPTALPDLGEGGGCDELVVEVGTGRYLGSYDGRGRFWAARTQGDELCFVIELVDGQSMNYHGPVTAQGFLDNRITGAGYGQGFDGFRYAIVPDGYDTTALEAEGHVQVLPNVLVDD